MMQHLWPAKCSGGPGHFRVHDIFRIPKGTRSGEGRPGRIFFGMCLFPLQAIGCQIIVMVMLAESTAIGTLLVVYRVRKLCFGPGERLLLQPGSH
jgi:hypothetical protein